MADSTRTGRAPVRHLIHQLDATRPRAAELFAGVGGFRLGLEATGWHVVWSNQWEPATKAQHASDCYVRHFGEEGHVCDDIAQVLDAVESGATSIPDIDLLVGGFPCQDYSVAKLLSHARGIEGKKGVLWWEIHRLLRLKQPRLVFLENVDRLLNSPATQRGRDFGIMLASLADLGYDVEWRVVNAADYGFPQRRRRVFIVARAGVPQSADPVDRIERSGVLARALPVIPEPQQIGWMPYMPLEGDLPSLTEHFGATRGPTPFRNAGYMSERMVWTRDLLPAYDGARQTLHDVLEPIEDVDPSYLVAEIQIPAWRYLKGAKHERRVHKASGSPYFYTEGPLPFPDPIHRPARTILTGEGGSTPSRFKHIIETPDGRYRRLTPRELERLNGFRDDWTAGMSDGRRAFMMGNALVVGLIEKVGQELLAELDELRQGVEVPAAAS
jgi:DNA (cytosine-5)-methyltransferase 1